MAASTPIQLTPAERGAYAHFFALADPQSTGVVSGSNAVNFFALSGLHPTVLGAVWEMSDRDQNGFLTPAHFSIALRLIGHAQAGSIVTEELLSKPGPMPTFKGVTLPAHLNSAAQGLASPSTPSRQGSAIVPQATGGSFSGTATVGEIRPEDRARYTRIFAGAGPQGGFIDGEKAKNIFVKSKLPFEQLGQIWNLADTKSGGQLDLTDFIIGMHFIQCTMNGSLKQVPASLPAGLYEKAAGTPGAGPMTPQPTGGSASGFLPRQMTGTGPAPYSPSPSSPAQGHNRGASGTPLALRPQRTGTMAGASGWVVSPADKAKSDSFFDGLDQDKKGVLDGAAAVPFFLQSGLGEAVLAHVWDLSDITQSGALTRDEFAVAMHLINAKLTGTDLPQELPQNLIPPSLRGQSLPQAVNPQQSDTQKDLFSLMDDDVDLPVSTATAFAAPVPASSTSTPSRGAPVPAHATSKGAFDSAFDDDFAGFGTGSKPINAMTTGAGTPPVLSPQATGASTSSRATAPRSAFPSMDASTEAANHRLALESTERSLSNMQTEKSELEKSTASDASSISDLKTRLETVRMRHQTESEAVTALRQRNASQAAELKRLREESVREESELSRLREEKDELEQALMKDREDVRELNRLVSERNKEKEAVKAEIEKIKKDSRQQKGLLAIGKKQVSQAESDLTKTKEEHEQTKTTIAEEEQAAEHASHGDVPVATSSTAQEPALTSVVSPAASTRSYNPFDRLAPTATGGSQHGSSAAFGAAALGGAALAGAGTAAIIHHSSEQPSEAAKTAQQQADEDDPFGLNTQQTAAPVTQEADGGFDDDFGQDAEPTHAAAQSSSASAPSHSFDDAFAEMNDTTTKDAAPMSAEEPVEELATSDSILAPAPTAAVADEPASAIPGAFEPAQEQAEPSSDTIDTSEGHSSSDVAAATTGAMQPLPSSTDEPAATSVDKGKGVARDDTEDDSSDEDEGPEDLESRNEGFGQGRGTSSDEAAAPMGFTDSRDESQDSVLAAQTGLQEPAAPQTLMAPPVNPLPASTDLSRAHSASGVSESDAFHDAFSESAPGSNLTAAGLPAAPAHDKFATAVEEPASMSPSSTLRASSPAKSRRAPPAIPSRGGTLAGAEGATSVVPSAAAAQASPMDDFDAAFEDLGPVATNNGGSNAADLTQTSAGGFDDAFGDADGFDFVPSFSQNDIAGRDASQSAAAPNAGTYNAPDAFNGFDSAFDASPFGASAAGNANPAATAHGQQTNTSSSGAGSGFSFEDAFVPPEAIRTGNTPPPTANFAPVAAAVAPPAPPRGAARASQGGSTAAASTGALPDDAGPVKQLCQMGFSRADVIKALERSNYRTEKALEKLLAQA